MSVAREHEHDHGPAVDDALRRGRERAGARPGGPAALLALQRSAGNAAVSALMAAKVKASGGAVAEIDRALTEVKGNDPDVAVVEKGLKATKDAGIPVDLDGAAQKPPASALVVTTTGFGPASVAAKKPVPPTKPTKPVSPLGKAGAKPPKPAVKAPPAKGPSSEGAGGAGGGGGGAGAAGGMEAPAPLSADKVLQPPTPPAGTRPSDDPAFGAVAGGVGAAAQSKKAHPGAASKATEAQGAALAPADDVAGQAKAAKADTMDAQQPGSFDKQAFIAAVKTAIEAKAPKSLEEASSGQSKAGEVKGEVKGVVTAGKEGAGQAIEQATDAPPDQSKAVPKEVTPLAQETAGAAPVVPATGAAPKPAPAEQTNLEAGKHQADQEMADAGVTEQQLAKSNEPEFEGALKEKQKAAAHADTAPQQFRAHEKETIEQHKAQAAEETQAGVAGMQGAKSAAIAHLVQAKGATKSKDEAKRAEVTNKIQSIFTATETDVKKILEGIDPKVDQAFETGEASARAAFEAFVAAKMSAYKRDRYGGWLGGLKWAKDKLLGMPSAVNEFYVAGRELYLQKMDGVITRVADVVGGDLTAAKQRISKGRADIAAYVKTLSPALQKVGNEATKDIADKFEQLESDVADKQKETVDNLATKYVEARKGLDERISEMQAENQGWVDAAIGAIKGVINTIKELVTMLTNVLARAASAVNDIIKDPVGFLGNLVAGVKGGIMAFFANIGKHLKKGLMGWLFGQLANAGIELPETFDLKGIIKLLASLFGLTWANIRNRIVLQIGEKAMGAIEKGVDIFQKLATQGVGGLWELLMDKLGDIKTMIMEQIEDFVVTKVITAGITWLIGLLNPAAAFIKACKLIYDVVMFFVSNASRIATFVNTVIDSVVDIAKGNVSGVVKKIEDVLGQMVPILIGFLASVLGVGGIGEKIRSILQKLQKPVNKALDFVIKTGLKLAGPVIRGLKGIGDKAKKKVAAGKAWVKGKVDKAKGWAGDKARKVGEALGIIKKPFRAGSESHTLSVDARTGAIRMASTEGPVKQVVMERVRAMEARWREEGRSPAEIKAFVPAIMAQIDRAQATIKAAKGNANAAGKRELDRLAPLIIDLIVKIGATGTETKADKPSGLGNIAPHGSQPSRASGGAQARVMESEHIIPVRLVSALMEQLGETEIIKRGGSEDTRQHTIMIYKGAATSKTRGVEAADWNLIRQLKAIALTGTPAIEGTNLTAKRMQEDPAAFEKIRKSFAKKRKQLKDTLISKLPAIFAARVGMTARNVVSDHSGAQKIKARGHTEPLPTEDKIRTAASHQAQDIVAIVSERFE